VPFHHDPTHSDAALDALFHPLKGGAVEVIPAAEGLSVQV